MTEWLDIPYFLRTRYKEYNMNRKEWNLKIAKLLFPDSEIELDEKDNDENDWVVITMEENCVRSKVYVDYYNDLNTLMPLCWENNISMSRLNPSVTTGKSSWSARAGDNVCAVCIEPQEALMICLLIVLQDKADVS